MTVNLLIIKILLLFYKNSVTISVINVSPAYPTLVPTVNHTLIIGNSGITNLIVYTIYIVYIIYIIHIIDLYPLIIVYDLGH